MNPLALVPLLILQAPQAPFPEVEGKDLPAAPRGPMPPQIPDGGADPSIPGRSRHQARQNPSLPARQLPAGSVRVKDQIPDISGWRAYAIEVPGGGTVRVHVVEGRKAWFRVLGVNSWGQEEQGLLINRIHTGEPEARYRNPTDKPRTVYFIVDTMDYNMVGETYTMEVTRG